MKKILYTVCSANHLAHCQTMVQSFLQFNPGYEVVIGLVDKINGRFDPQRFAPCRLLEVDTLAIPDFDQMAKQYTVIELNCAMKAFLAAYIMDHYAPDILLYLDADIWVFDSFDLIEERLKDHEIVLTPHFMEPMPDNELLPRERDLLRSGLYNAGFLGFKAGENTSRFIHWWCGHMTNECYYRFEEGMGVDQNWLNLVPFFFEKVHVLKEKRANVAYWNLHERTITKTGNRWMVNEQEPLLFLHISGYRFSTPEILSRHQTRFNLADMPALSELLHAYKQQVVSNGYDGFIDLPCAFAKPVKKSTGLLRTLNRLLSPTGWKLSKV